MRDKRKRQPYESQSRRNHGSRQSRRETPRVEKVPQYAREGSGGTQESPAGAGEPVHGVREPAGQYGSPQDPDGGAEGQSELGSTREFETAEGRLSYQELSQRLAVPLVAIYDEILQCRPDQIVITSEWLCLRHKHLAGHLFPDWAGRFRDVNVQVGSHTTTAILRSADPHAAVLRRPERTAVASQSGVSCELCRTPGLGRLAVPMDSSIQGFQRPHWTCPPCRPALQARPSSCRDRADWENEPPRLCGRTSVGG